MAVRDKVARKLEHLPFDPEAWYPALGPELTFPTEIIPLTPNEARSCVAFYQRRYNNKPELTLDHVNTLRALETRITVVKILTHSFSYIHLIFFRLCIRRYLRKQELLCG